MALDSGLFPPDLWRIVWREKVLQWLKERIQLTDFGLDGCLEILNKNILVREAALAAFWGAYLANKLPPTLSDQDIARIKKLLDYGLPNTSQSKGEIEELAFAKLHLAGLLAVSLIRPDCPTIESPSAIDSLEKAQEAYKLAHSPGIIDEIIDAPSSWGKKYFDQDLLTFSLVLVGGITRAELSFVHTEKGNYEEAFWDVTNAAWDICATTVASESGDLPDFRPYLPHSGDYFNIQEVADIFEEVKRHEKRVKNWEYVKISCEAIQHLGYCGLYDCLLDGIRDANGDEFGAAEYWGRAITFAEGQMRLQSSPTATFTRDVMERAFVEETLKRDFFLETWEEMTQEAKEILIDAEIAWIHDRLGSMVRDIRPLLELVLLATLPFLKDTFEKKDSHLILTRMRDKLVSNAVVRSLIDALHIAPQYKMWAKDELPRFLHKTIEARNYFEKERYLPGKKSEKSAQMLEKAVSIHSELLGIGCEGVLPRLIKIKQASSQSK